MGVRGPPLLSCLNLLASCAPRGDLLAWVVQSLHDEGKSGDDLVLEMGGRCAKLVASGDPIPGDVTAHNRETEAALLEGAGDAGPTARDIHDARAIGKAGDLALAEMVCSVEVEMEGGVGDGGGGWESIVCARLDGWPPAALSPPGCHAPATLPAVDCLVARVAATHLQAMARAFLGKRRLRAKLQAMAEAAQRAEDDARRVVEEAAAAAQRAEDDARRVVEEAAAAARRAVEGARKVVEEAAAAAGAAAATAGAAAADASGARTRAEEGRAAAEAFAEQAQAVGAIAAAAAAAGMELPEGGQEYKNDALDEAPEGKAVLMNLPEGGQEYKDDALYEAPEVKATGMEVPEGGQEPADATIDEAMEVKVSGQALKDAEAAEDGNLASASVAAMLASAEFVRVQSEACQVTSEAAQLAVGTYATCRATAEEAVATAAAAAAEAAEAAEKAAAAGAAAEEAGGSVGVTLVLTANSKAEEAKASAAAAAADLSTVVANLAALGTAASLAVTEAEGARAAHAKLDVLANHARDEENRARQVAAAAACQSRAAAAAAAEAEEERAAAEREVHRRRVWCAVQIQAMVRGYQAFTRYGDVRRASASINRCARGYLGRKKVRKMRKEIHAALLIQRCLRGLIARCRRRACSEEKATCQCGRVASGEMLSCAQCCEFYHAHCVGASRWRSGPGWSVAARVWTCPRCLTVWALGCRLWV